MANVITGAPSLATNEIVIGANNDNSVVAVPASGLNLPTIATPLVTDQVVVGASSDTIKPLPSQTPGAVFFADANGNIHTDPSFLTMNLSNKNLSLGGHIRRYNGQDITSGKMLIGSTTSNSFILSTLQSGGGTIAVTNGNGFVNLDVVNTPGNNPVRYVTGTTGADIQTAINIAPAGSIIQLGCISYSVGVTSLSITKGIHLQGCGGPQSSGSVVGTIISGAPGTTRINIDTSEAVQISDLMIRGTGGETLVTMGPTRSDGATFRNVALRAGGNGIDASDALEFTFRDSVADGQSGFALKVRSPTDPDRGSAWIQNNFIVGLSGGASDKGIILQDTSSSFISGNKIINFGTCLDIEATIPGAHSEYHITGNALTCGQSGVSTGGSLRVAAVGAGIGALEITGNYIDALGFGGVSGIQPTVILDGGAQVIANVSFTGNTLRTGVSPGAGAVLGSNLLGAVFSGNTIDFWAPNAPGYAFNITGSGGVQVANTTYVRSGFVSNPYQGSAYTVNDSGVGSPIPFSVLGTITPSNGSQIYCSDCNLTGSMAVCTGGGGGSMATRLSGAWRCQ